MSQWGGRVSLVRHQTFRPATTPTRSPRSSGAGALRLSAWTCSRSPAPGVAAAAVRVTSTDKSLVRGTPQAENREQERGEEDLHADDHERRREDRHAFLCQAAESSGYPLADDDGAERDAGEREPAAREQSVLEPELGDAAIEPGVRVAEMVDGVDAGAEAEAEELRADHDQERTADQRVDPKRVPEDRRLA